MAISKLQLAVDNGISPVRNSMKSSVISNTGRSFVSTNGKKSFVSQGGESMIKINKTETEEDTTATGNA